MFSEYQKLQRLEGAYTGMKIVKEYFEKPLECLRTNSGLTKQEWIDSYKHKPYVMKLIQYYVLKRLPIEKALSNAFEIYSRCGSMKPFVPIRASRLYKTFKSKQILDPCAGWGSRCLGAIAVGADYIGFDTNTGLKECYEKMLSDFSHNSTVELYYQDSSLVDFRDYGNYDMVFTSPPYWFPNRNKPTEIYEEMPNYTDYQDWFSRFITPMIRNAWIGLDKDGVFALNIPEYLYDDIRDRILGECDEIWPLSNRIRATSKRRDWIYIWKKRDRLPLPTFENEYVEVRHSTIGKVDGLTPIT